MMKTGSEDITRGRAIQMLLTMGFFILPGTNALGKLAKPDSNNTLRNRFAKQTEHHSMKTIGVLGGLGPQATMDLEMRIHKISQQLIPAAQNSGYPPMVVQYFRHTPVLLDSNFKPLFPMQPDPRLIEAVKALSTISDFLVVPSNGMHVFQNEFERATGKKMISMIDAVLNEAKRRSWKKIGVMGLMSPKVYIDRFEEQGIRYETIDTTLQEKLNQAIFRVMEGREDSSDCDVVMEAVKYFRSKNVDGIIPGCTEIPFLLGNEMNADDVINPAQLLAEAAVKFAMKD